MTSETLSVTEESGFQQDFTAFNALNQIQITQNKNAVKAQKHHQSADVLDVLKLVQHTHANTRASQTRLGYDTLLESQKSKGHSVQEVDAGLFCCLDDDERQQWKEYEEIVSKAASQARLGRAPALDHNNDVHQHFEKLCEDNSKRDPLDMLLASMKKKQEKQQEEYITKLQRAKSVAASRKTSAVSSQSSVTGCKSLLGNDVPSVAAATQATFDAFSDAIQVPDPSKRSGVLKTSYSISRTSSKKVAVTSPTQAMTSSKSGSQAKQESSTRCLHRLKSMHSTSSTVSDLSPPALPTVHLHDDLPGEHDGLSFYHRSGVCLQQEVRQRLLDTKSRSASPVPCASLSTVSTVSTSRKANSTTSFSPSTAINSIADGVAQARRSIIRRGQVAVSPGLAASAPSLMHMAQNDEWASSIFDCTSPCDLTTASKTVSGCLVGTVPDNHSGSYETSPTRRCSGPFGSNSSSGSLLRSFVNAAGVAARGCKPALLMSGGVSNDDDLLLGSILPCASYSDDASLISSCSSPSWSPYRSQKLAALKATKSVRLAIDVPFDHDDDGGCGCCTATGGALSCPADVQASRYDAALMLDGGSSFIGPTAFQQAPPGLCLHCEDALWSSSTQSTSSTRISGVTFADGAGCLNSSSSRLHALARARWSLDNSLNVKQDVNGRQQQMTEKLCSHTSYQIGIQAMKQVVVGRGSLDTAFPGVAPPPTTTGDQQTGSDVGRRNSTSLVGVKPTPPTSSELLSTCSTRKRQTLAPMPSSSQYTRALPANAPTAASPSRGRALPMLSSRLARLADEVHAADHKFAALINAGKVQATHGL